MWYVLINLVENLNIWNPKYSSSIAIDLSYPTINLIWTVLNWLTKYANILKELFFMEKASWNLNLKIFKSELLIISRLAIVGFLFEPNMQQIFLHSNGSNYFVRLKNHFFSIYANSFLNRCPYFALILSSLFKGFIRNYTTDPKVCLSCQIMQIWSLLH